MRTYASLAAVSALALLSASTDAGGVAPGQSTPQTADEKAPAEPQAETQAQAPALAPNADPNPPVGQEAALDAKAAAKGKKGETKPGKAGTKPAEAVDAGDWTVMVWAQPGHEKLHVGKVIRVSSEQAENLRGAGRARYASEAEIEAAGADIAELEGL